MATIINATPHNITLHVNGVDTVYEKSELLARVSSSQEAVFDLPFPAVKNTLGDVEGLPDPEDDVFFIVSGMVLSASNRNDLIAPDTGPSCIRNEKGHILAVTRFVTK